VNVSSRIEPLAAPGGVCLSGQVYDHVRNKLELPLEKLDEKSLKNVKMPIDVYRIVMPWEAASPKEAVELDTRRLAVLPLQNLSPDPNDEYFADGMTEELITTLAGVSELTVIARTSVMQYKKTTKKVVDIGRELSAGTVLEGSIRKAGNKVRITIQLIDARNDGHIWAQNYDRELDDIFAIQSEIAEKVAGTLRVKLLESEKGRMESRQANDVGAYTLYLKGRHYWNERTRQGMEKAIEYFEAAIKRDPSFARGHSGLADCYGVMSHNGMMEPEAGYRKAKESADKALELDPTLAEPHAVLANFALYVGHDPKKSEEEYLRTIELNPSYASAHQWYSQLLLFERRYEECTREISKARELDPLSLIINVNFGDNLYYRGRFDEAVAHLQNIVALNPDFAVAYPSLLQAYLRKRMFEDALRAADTYSQLIDDQNEADAWRSYIYGTMGRVDEARGLISKVERNWTGNQYSIGLCYFAMGDPDKGFYWLEEAFRKLDAYLYGIGVDYELDAFRSDPRYLSLTRRLGLLS
jgi:adenylate cyclase